MAWMEKLHYPKRYILAFLKWSLLGIFMGVLGGLLGAGFHHVLHFAIHLRGEHTWLIFLLPVGGVLTVGLYRLCACKIIRVPTRSSMPPWMAAL